MSVEQRPCGTPGCDVSIPAYLEFCGAHFAQLPQRQRARINRAARRLGRKPRQKDRLNTFLAARAEAHKYLEEATA